MSDLLCRRFRDKIHARSHGGPRMAAAVEVPAESIPADSIRILGLEHGLVVDAAAINPRFPPDQPLIRLTIALGRNLQSRTRPLDSVERSRLLALCPGLPLHGCGASGGILDLLSPLAGRTNGGRSEPNRATGIETAHLIEHVALELLTVVEGGAGRAGATGAHRHTPGCFDVLLECGDPGLGRAVALLAAAAVRDLAAPTDRSTIHERCVCLLGQLVTGGRETVVAEDVADHCGWTLDEARSALEQLVRLSFLEPFRAPLTFSSSTGVLFRRATP